MLSQAIARALSPQQALRGDAGELGPGPVAHRPRADPRAELARHRRLAGPRLRGRGRGGHPRHAGRRVGFGTERAPTATGPGADPWAAAEEPTGTGPSSRVEPGHRHRHRGDAQHHRHAGLGRRAARRRRRRAGAGGGRAGHRAGPGREPAGGGHRGGGRRRPAQGPRASCSASWPSWSTSTARCCTARRVDGLVAVFGLEVAGEDDIAGAMQFSTRRGRAGARGRRRASWPAAARRCASPPAPASRRRRAAARCACAATPIEEARLLARGAEPGRPLLDRRHRPGGVGPVRLPRAARPPPAQPPPARARADRAARLRRADPRRCTSGAAASSAARPSWSGWRPRSSSR